MRVSINGAEREVEARDIAALVTELDLDPRKVAVELNMAIVPRSLHAVTPLSEGDRLEVVQFVGGG
jgi:sulfur carrier protein